jgi:hypothetical protein
MQHAAGSVDVHLLPWLLLLLRLLLLPPLLLLLLLELPLQSRKCVHGCIDHLPLR